MASRRFHWFPRASRKSRRSSRPSRGIAFPTGKRWVVQTETGRILGEHAKRLDAEMDAVRKSKKGAWVEVRDRKSPRFEWVSIYRDGWLKDSGRRGSYVPLDQRQNWARLGK